MLWQVKIHNLVIKEDFKKINKGDQEIILKTIYKKLSVAPDKYGFPLRNELKGYWKLKVADYRVIYKMENNEVIVYVLKVGMRRDESVYREMYHRIIKL